MKNKFKKGDVIVCIDDSEQEDSLTNGKEYLVIEAITNADYVQIANNGGKLSNWYSRRFTLKEENTILIPQMFN